MFQLLECSANIAQSANVAESPRKNARARGAIRHALQLPARMRKKLKGGRESPSPSCGPGYKRDGNVSRLFVRSGEWSESMRGLPGSLRPRSSLEPESPFGVPGGISELPAERSVSTLGLFSESPSNSRGGNTENGNGEDRNPSHVRHVIPWLTDNDYDADDEAEGMNHMHHEVVGGAGDGVAAGRGFVLFPGGWGETGEVGVDARMGGGADPWYWQHE